MSSKQRVYEVAKQIQVDQKELVALAQSWGLNEVKNHMSTLEPDVAERMKRHYDKLRQPATAEEKRQGVVAPTRRRTPARADDSPASAAPSTGAPASSVAVPSAAASSSTPVSVPAVRAPRASSAQPPPAPASVNVPAPPPSRGSTKVTAPAEARAVVPPSRGSTRVDRGESASVAPVTAAAPSRTEPVEAPAPVVAETKAAPAVEAPATERPKSAPAPVAEVAAVPAARPSTKAAVASGASSAASTAGASTASSTPEVAPAPAAAPAVEAAKPASVPAPAVVRPAESAPAEPTSEPEEPAPLTTASPMTVASPSRTTSAPTARPAAAQPAAPSAPSAPSPAPARPATGATAPITRPATPAAAAAPTSTTTGAAAAAPGAAPAARVPKRGIEVWSGWQKDPPPSTARPGMAGRRQQIDISRGPQRPGGPPSGRPGAPMSMRPGMPGRPGFGNNRRFGGPPSRSGPKGVNTAERKEKVIKLEGNINLQTLAARMSLKANDVLFKLLQFTKGVNINSSLDIDTAQLLANEFGWEVEDVSITEEQQLDNARGEQDLDENAVPRPPIVTVMGHVDHGKTSLLDQIRKTKVAEGEAGGITQHIGAYRVATRHGILTFLDTPGHEAFTAMRARGANLTDIVVLVVAADDGVMPQTREAVTHAKAAKVPIIVAVNKIDKPGADIERVKRQMMELDLVPEELGGDVIFCPVSAKTRLGIEELLDNIQLVAENSLELRANIDRNARAIVVESLLDKGKGPVARVIVRDGTLRVGDVILSGSSIGKIRAMTDDMGRQIKEAGPSTPVEILGLSDVPNAGDALDAVADPKKAQEIVEQRRDKERGQQKSQMRMTLDELSKRASAGEQLELRVLVKADVQGSVEAIRSALLKLNSPKVSLSVVDASVGAITESDINLAVVAKAIVVGFNVRPAGKAAQLAETEGVQIKQYSIIYQVIDDMRSAMEGLLAPIYLEKPLGQAQVRVVYKLSKSGAVAGCMVTQGLVRRNAKARVRRDNVVLLDTKITGLKRFKDDVRELAEGFECGISVETYEDIKEGDMIEVYELEQVRQTL